jgi:putative ABC transport system substrate-binding protein
MSGSRRQFLARAGAAVLGTVSFAARGQTAAKLYKVGVLMSEAPTSFLSFRQGLRDLGYVEGRNLLIEARFDKGNAEALPGFAAELVKLNVDVILASSSTYVRAVKQASRSIPIVFAVHNDPIGTGDVQSLARPGGRITGLTQMASDLSAKQLELFKEVVPRLTRVAIVSNPATPSNKPVMEQVQTAARTLRLQFIKLAAEDLSGLEQAFAVAIRERSDAVFIVLSPMTGRHAAKVADLAAKYRIPTFCGYQPFVDAGGLLAYSPDYHDLFRRAASYVDRILKGANPAELPVEQPTKFELGVNLKTARSLGLTIPRSVLLRADRVIE